MNQKSLIILFWITEILLIIGLIVGFYLRAFGIGGGILLGFFPAVSALTFIPFFIGIKKLKRQNLTFLSGALTLGIYLLLNYFMIFGMLYDILLKLYR